MGVIGVVGLGYVGLPLAVEFGKKTRTVGFDLMPKKIEAYRRHVDPTGEVSTEDLKAAKLLEPTSDPTRLAEADFIIVAVPTPIDAAHQPDFSPLVSASITVGRHMKKGTTVVYESTVYPGATEEVCIPLLERESGMKWKRDFLRRLFARADQPRRPRTHADADHQGRLRRHAGDTRARRADLSDGRQRGRAPRVEHQGRRGGQGDREHPARPEHRADERTRADLSSARDRHDGGTAGGRHQVELPAVSARDWSAATASGSIRTT